MEPLSLEEACQRAMIVGGAIAVVPAAATLLIASSKIILINILANAIFIPLTLGRFWIRVPASMIAVPFLWKASLVTGVVGGSIVAVAGLVLLGEAAYRQYRAR